MSNRKLNSYDVLMWWGKVLNSCNTEDQFKNALNLWPKVIELTPCVDDAWNEVVAAAKNTLKRIVPARPTRYQGHFLVFYYPKTTKALISHIFNKPSPPGAE